MQPRRPLRTYTVPQLVKVLQYDKKQIYKLLKSGKLRGRKLNDTRTGKWRVPEESVRKFLAGLDDTSIDIN